MSGTPGPVVQQGQVWTVAQWNAFFASLGLKADYTSIADINTALTTLISSGITQSVGLAATNNVVGNIQRELIPMQAIDAAAVAAITTLQSSDASQQNSTATLQISVAALQASDASHQANVAALQGSDAVLQANIVALQNAVAALQAGAAIPGAPTGLSTGTITSTTIVFNWITGAGPAATGYVLQRSPAGTNTWTTANTIASTAVTVTTTPPGATGVLYDWRVFGTNAAGSGPASSPPVTIGTLAAVPVAPTGLAGVVAGLTIVFTWVAGAGGSAATGYTLERSPAGAGTWTTADTIIAPTVTTTVTPPGAPGTQYDWRVFGTNGSGSGPPSTPITRGIPATVPTRPTGLAAGAVTATSIAWTWVAGVGGTPAAGYTLQRSPVGAGTFTTAATTVAPTVSVTATGLTPGASYDWQVFGTNAVGSGPVSTPPVNKATTPPAPVQSPAFTSTTQNAPPIIMANGDQFSVVAGRLLLNGNPAGSTNGVVAALIDASTPGLLYYDSNDPAYATLPGGIAWFLWNGVQGAPSFDPRPGQPTAVSTLAILNFIKQMAGHHVLVGQYIDSALSGAADATAFTTLTGKHVAILGDGYWPPRSTTAAANVGPVNTTAIAHWNAGGIPCLNVFYPSPSGGDLFAPADILQCITPGSAQYIALHARYDQEIAGLLALQTAGVVVLNRAFMECKPGLFWWSVGSASTNWTPANFITLWQQRDAYFKSKAVNNIIRIYSQGFNTGDGSGLNTYPGDAYVDFQGEDVFTDAATDFLALYQNERTQHPFVPWCMAEWGSGNTTTPDASFDMQRLINDTKNSLTQSCFFQAWSAGWRIASMTNVVAAMNDPYVLYRENLNRPGATPTESAHDTTVTTVGPSIVDAALNVWTLAVGTGGQASFQIVVNGVLQTITAAVDLIRYYNPVGAAVPGTTKQQVVQHNTFGDWFISTGISANIVSWVQIAGDPDIVSQAPAPAAAVGYNTQTFGDLVIPGTNWFAGPNGNNSVVQGDGSILFPGTAGYSANLQTVAIDAAGSTIGGRSFGGRTWGGGGYFECTMRYTGSTPPSGVPCPAFWLNDVENQLADAGTSGSQSHWPGQPAGYVDSIEWDITEVNNGFGSMGFTVHNWYGFNPANDQAAVSDGSPANGLGNQAVYFTVAGLWVPATDTTQGYIQHYYNGNPVGNRIVWNKYNPALGPPPHEGSNAFSRIDQVHMYMILGTGPANPMTVQRVRVFQANGSANLPPS